MSLSPLEDLTDLVKCGPRTEACDKEFASEALWAEATRATAGWVTGGTGQKMAAIIAGLPGFSGFRKMLDLGGGHGMFALYFIAAHPIMTGVVFDRQAVVAVAERFIQEYGMENRMSVRAGDYLSDHIGSEYDLVWACATLNFARYDLDPLIHKIYTSLNPGGVFISFQDGMTHEQTRPDIMLGHLGDAMRTGRDLYFNQGEICDAMLRCGFRSVRSRTIDTPMGAMDMDIAHK
jgi:predicted O-methyltransferase YrrM